MRKCFTKVSDCDFIKLPNLIPYQLCDIKVDVFLNADSVVFTELTNIFFLLPTWT